MKNIKSALKKYGIETDKWTRLIPNITIIHLNQDVNIYVKESQLFYFDTKNNLLKISENLQYINLKEIGTDYTATKFFDLSKIGGFISSTIPVAGGLYL